MAFRQQNNTNFVPYRLYGYLNQRMSKNKVFTLNKQTNNLWLFYSHELKLDVNPPLHAPRNSTTRTFHQNIRLFLTMGQIFALMPLSGISGMTAGTLRFSMFTLRMLYTLFIAVASFVMASITFYWNTVHKMNLLHIVHLIWFCVNTIAISLFISIARKWPALMAHWESFELCKTVQDTKIQMQSRKLITTFTILIPTLASFEHVLSLTNNIHTAISCNSTSGPMDTYFRLAFPSYYALFEVNYINGLGLQLLNLYWTYIWNFTDNFIIIISLGLITQFRHFNSQFERCQHMCFPDRFWGQQRVYYNKLANLIDHVNQDLAAIILLSYANNLFFICLQLFHSVTPSISVIRSIYFWYSLLYLIGRTIVVSIAAALINDESKKPIKILQMVPSSVYGDETKRFMDQISTTTIALSGMQFFYITRKFMLSVTGTIITYELVLIQLQYDQKDENPCEP